MRVSGSAVRRYAVAGNPSRSTAPRVRSEARNVTSWPRRASTDAAPNSGGRLPPGPQVTTSARTAEANHRPIPAPQHKAAVAALQPACGSAGVSTRHGGRLPEVDGHADGRHETRGRRAAPRFLRNGLRGRFAERLAEG